MHDQRGQNQFENSGEDQIMLEDPDYSLGRDGSVCPRERNTGKRQGGQNNHENEIITRSTRILEA